MQFRYRAIIRPQSAVRSKRSFELPTSGLLARDNFRVARDASGLQACKTGPNMQGESGNPLISCFAATR